MRISRPVIDRREAAIVAAISGGVFVAIGYATGLGVQLDSSPIAMVTPHLHPHAKAAPSQAASAPQWMTGQMAGVYAMQMAPAADMAAMAEPEEAMDMPSAAPSVRPTPRPAPKPTALSTLTAPVTSLLPCLGANGLPVVGGLLNGVLPTGSLLSGLPVVGGLAPGPSTPQPSCRTTPPTGGLL